MEKIRHSMYYRRDGTPYEGENPWLQWAKDFEDFKARKIASTELPWGGHVSTVWLGLDHRMGDGKPLIFESMVFGIPVETELLGKKRMLPPDMEMRRYSTEKEAIEGHEALVAAWQKVKK